MEELVKFKYSIYLKNLDIDMKVRNYKYIKYQVN